MDSLGCFLPSPSPSASCPVYVYVYIFIQKARRKIIQKNTFRRAESNGRPLAPQRAALATMPQRSKPYSILTASYLYTPFSAGSTRISGEVQTTRQSRRVLCITSEMAQRVPLVAMFGSSTYTLTFGAQSATHSRALAGRAQALILGGEEIVRRALSPEILRLGYRTHARCRGPVCERNALVNRSEVTTVTLVSSRSSSVFLCVRFVRPLCLSSALSVEL
uniref:Uncharacterized protein n=1 Tax=Rhipicephalus pulchellus TaxID=72859 RepID=L7LXJ8_RHIPC